MKRTGCEVLRVGALLLQIRATAEDRDAVGGRRAPVHRREALLETSLGCDDGIDLGAHAHLLKEEFAVCRLKRSPELVELLADEAESSWSAQCPDRRRGRLRCRPFRFRLSGFEHTRAFLLRSTAALSRLLLCAPLRVVANPRMRKTLKIYWKSMSLRWL